MGTFTHFVITRFNIKNSEWDIDKNGQRINNTLWLKERYHLFETYCFPSIASQIEKGFRWLVFFDEDTPDYFKTKNNDLADVCPQFEAIYVTDYLDFINQSKTTIRKCSKTDFIITTRFDNDDCFHVNAIKTIQHNFIPESNTIIDLTNGLTLQIGKFKKLAKKTNISSGPFISYIEKMEQNSLVKTVYDCEHSAWVTKADFVKVNSGFFWLQIIHDRNISNKLHDNFSVNKKLLKGFIFNVKVKFTFSYYTIVILKFLGFFRFYYTIKRKLI